MNTIRVTASAPASSALRRLRTISSSATAGIQILPRHAQRARSYATHRQQSPRPEQAEAARRRAVTPFNDDGRVAWTDLSGSEKVGRAAQQTVNFGMVILGLVLTGGVGYVLYTEVFSLDSKTSYYNRAVDRIKKDPRCLELLGDSRKIVAFGEETGNKWRRARPIASTASKDANGNDHLMIQFNIQGPRGSARVNLHLVKRAGGSEYEYKYFFLETRNRQRIYLENADAAARAEGKRKSEGLKMFGIRWS